MAETGIIESIKAEKVFSALRKVRPVTKNDLRNYVKVFLGIDVPDQNVCDGHSSPMDYLWHSYSSDFSFGPAGVNSDCVVWANRGGSKTVLGAVATLLDCIFKPGCQVRILGGSIEQSSRMYDYLTDFVCRGFGPAANKNILKDKCSFKNGSSAQMLTQSSRSVRGIHVHKLRCDEIELFDEMVFEAAKFTTRSTNGIIAGMEVISTMHRPYGLMQNIVKESRENKTPVFKWCMWEVIEKCRYRNCSRCALDNYCQGKARLANGYMKIDDCITQMRRSSRTGFESEMLCEKPNLDNIVFSEFSPDVHVAQIEYDSNLPLYRAIDFGFVNPFVCLWIQVDKDGNVRVIDEYIRRRATIDVHAEELKRRTPCDEEAVAATYCDPAGAGANDVSGTSAVRELRSMGINTRYRRSRILDGIELIRRAVRAGDGKNRLLINGNCVRLIEAMRCYHYPDSPGQESELPEKDGVYDHPIDALRYFFINVKTKFNTTSRSY